MFLFLEIAKKKILISIDNTFNEPFGIRISITQNKLDLKL